VTFQIARLCDTRLNRGARRSAATDPVAASHPLESPDYLGKPLVPQGTRPQRQASIYIIEGLSLAGNILDILMLVLGGLGCTFLSYVTYFESKKQSDRFAFIATAIAMGILIPFLILGDFVSETTLNDAMSSVFVHLRNQFVLIPALIVAL